MTPASVLNNQNQSLVVPFVIAAMGHLIVAIALLFGSWMTERNRKPIVELAPMEVTLMVIPKAKSRMPTKATRAARPKGREKPVIKAQKPPPRESDLSVYKLKAKETVGAPDRSNDRKALLNKMLMAQLVNDAAAETSTHNRERSDPNSTTTESVNSSNGIAGDPEIAKYEAQIRALFLTHFKPLPTVVSGNPDISCIIRIHFDQKTGRVTQSGFHIQSGNPSYDAAAKRAVRMVPAIPLPPERIAARYTNGLSIRFTPPQ